MRRTIEVRTGITTCSIGEPNNYPFTGESAATLLYECQSVFTFHRRYMPIEKKNSVPMQDIIVTTLSPHEFRAIIMDCVESCLKRYPFNPPTPQETKTNSAGVFISKKQAAALLSCCVSTIDNHARAQVLTRYYVGKSVRFNRQQVLSLAKSPEQRRSRIKRRSNVNHDVNQ